MVICAAMPDYRPNGYHSITPVINVRGAAAYLGFLRQAFDAEVLSRSAQLDGTVVSAQVLMGDSLLEITEARTDSQPTVVLLHLYVRDVDAAYHNALGAGAASLRAPANHYYGDREAKVKDAWGITWRLATHVEDIDPEEMARREEEFMSQRERRSSWPQG